MNIPYGMYKNKLEIYENLTEMEIVLNHAI